MVRKTLVATLITAAVLAGAVSYYIFSSRNTDLEKLTAGVENSFWSSIIWIAEEEGFFEDAGLDLTIKEFDSGKESFLNLLKTDSDLSICTVDTIPVMLKSFERKDFSILSTFVYSYEYIKVVARKDIGIKTAEDLKGRTIGTPFGTTNQFFMEEFLIYNQVNPSVVKSKDIDPDKLPGALKSHQVDAAAIWEPYACKTSKLLGSNAVKLKSSDIFRESFNLVVMNDYAKENKALLIKFLKALDKAVQFCTDNREAAKKIVIRRMGLEMECFVLSHWDKYHSGLSLDQSLLITLEEEARWAVNKKMVKSNHIPDYLDYINFEILEHVKPDAVGIVR
ncbi:MAG: ABC transporter substrate-binding protein [bacterium]|nr:ABC transporter substrate-binding protein [bacterium]